MNFIDGDFFENLAKYRFDNVISRDELYRLTENDDKPLIYIKNDFLQEFLEIVAKIDKQVDIIAHNSDKNYTNIDVPDNVRNIYCQNFNGINEKIVPLPIGLERKRWFPHIGKQNILNEYMKRSFSKYYKVYMNFSTGTNPVRVEYYNHFKDIDYVYTEMKSNGQDYKNYIDKICRSEFVFSPVGNGIDCHRTWECLYLDVVPIVEKNNFSNSIYNDMDVLLVDSLKDVDYELLDSYVKKHNKEKLTQEYWTKKILNK